MRKDFVGQETRKRQRKGFPCAEAWLGLCTGSTTFPGRRPSLQAGRSEVGFLEGSGPCSDLGNGPGAVVAPSTKPGLPLGCGFEGQAPCNVETVADAEASWVSQTHLMSFNNNLE